MDRSEGWTRHSVSHRQAPSEEIEEEGALIPKCVFQPLESPMGHVAESAADMQPQIEAAIGACLALQGAPKL